IQDKSWLWHRRLSHLNFGAINHLARQGLVRGLPKLKFEKDHLCSACAMGKSTKKMHKPKSEDTNQKKLYLLHMDLCGPIRFESVNGKKYILIIVDDYSRFTWLKFLRSKDETPNFIIKFLKMIQNEVVERRNRTLIEAARTMLIYAQAPLFLWAEAVATARFTQNRSIIRLRHGKTPYELLHSKLPDLSFFHVFGALCYLTNDCENLAMASEQSSLGPALNEMIPRTISSGLVRTSSPSTSYVATLRNDWDLMFQPMFDELLNPSPSVVNQAPEVIAPIAEAYKEALTQSCWIKAMQEDLNEFEHLEVWELVPRPDQVMVITLKWIYKVKLDELGGILKNKARLVARGYHQEEGINFEESQPDGFVDSDNPNHVYKLKKALYGLKQALRACGYSNGGKSKLDEDREGKAVDPSHYHGMIGTLLYLTASRLDLQFAICMCARYQARPTKKHVHTVKRIFRYLRRTVHQGLWYPKDSSVALTAFADADHPGLWQSQLSNKWRWMGLLFPAHKDVPEIYMQEFWATAYVHQHSIIFKLNNKKHIVNLKTFRDMLHICLRIPGQSFDELSFEEDIFEFFRFLGHSAQIRTLTDVNINKLFQPWRSFGAVINKCLTGKSSSFDSFRIMATTIDQQVALDEALDPSTQRLRIGRSNFRLPSNIQSKESTLQVVYDVLRNSPFFRAFQVTADVPEIYMQEFWATAKLHHNSIPDLSEMELKKILIEKMEGNKSIQRSDEQRNIYKALVEAYEADKIILDTYGETVTLKKRRDDESNKDEGPSAGSDRGSQRRRKGKEPESASASLQTATRSVGRSTTGSKSRQASTSESAFAEEPVQTTSHIEEPSHPVFETAVQGSTQTWISELAKQADSRSSFNELLDTPLDFSNFIMNRLRVDTLTPELFAGPTYELMKGSCKSLTKLEYHLKEPLSLIPDNRGRRVIPFVHFINNNLDYLRGGASSGKYTTSVTKSKAADYGHIKWIEDLGRKRQQFYGFAVNRESALDVYSKRRIITVIDLKIVEWHSYKHLDWITVRRDDDKLYKFKEGNFKRMFTRSIVIQRRVKDLQLGVESYQKRLNLTKPDTYRSDLKRREAYTAYSNPRGFIYQNKDKKNRLMRIDELHKFSNGTLNDVRNALDDRLKGIRMQYLPQTIWRKGDKDRAAAMIQAIDKMLKTRRIMRSLKRFVGGRLYEGDFRMLQRTI
nr:hypothetical protein [Tanacetum cinerariifolium]